MNSIPSGREPSGVSAPSLCVAIDGPAASGKSTVSKAVARQLGATVVDSGAWYRGMTWAALRHGANPRDPDAVRAVMKRTRWMTEVTGGEVAFTVDGVRPENELRSEAVRESVSDVAAIPEVRAFIVERLRETTRHGAVVMEGRDIGTVVFPGTPFKFYLDADPAERARRRLRDIVELEGQGDVESVRLSLERRDTKDSTRAADPLRIAPDAVILDSTALSIPDVVEAILRSIRDRSGAA